MRIGWIVLVGLALGAAAGLAYAWVINPVRYRDTAPLSLAPEHKDTYRLLIAASYGANGNLERARARLALLEDPDPVRALAAQAQQAVAVGGLSTQARQLAGLAAALSQNPAPEAPSSATPQAASQEGLPGPLAPVLTGANPSALPQPRVFP
jgi:hypothetical protein